MTQLFSPRFYKKYQINSNNNVAVVEADVIAHRDLQARAWLWLRAWIVTAWFSLDEMQASGDIPLLYFCYLVSDRSRDEISFKRITGKYITVS